MWPAGGAQEQCCQRKEKGAHLHNDMKNQCIYSRTNTLLGTTIVPLLHYIYLLSLFSSYCSRATREKNVLTCEKCFQVEIFLKIPKENNLFLKKIGA